MYRTIARGGIWRGDLRNRAKDGSLYWVDTTIIPVLGPSGKIDCYISVCIDITERVRVTESLRSTGDFLEAIIEHAPAVIYVKDARDLTYLLINGAAERYYGKSRESMIGKTAYDVFEKSSAERIMHARQGGAEIPHRAVRWRTRDRDAGQWPAHCRDAPIADPRCDGRGAISRRRDRGHHRAACGRRQDRLSRLSRRSDRSRKPNSFQRIRHQRDPASRRLGGIHSRSFISTSIASRKPTTLMVIRPAMRSCAKCRSACGRRREIVLSHVSEVTSFRSLFRARRRRSPCRLCVTSFMPRWRRIFGSGGRALNWSQHRSGGFPARRCGCTYIDEPCRCRSVSRQGGWSRRDAFL